MKVGASGSRAEQLLPTLNRGMCINQDRGGDCEGFIEEHLVRALPLHCSLRC
jgi:hypothetical protein